jgi:hypothetical protein
MTNSTPPVLTTRSQARLVFLALFALTFVSHPCIAQISPKASQKERLAQFITNPPDVVQFAKDRKYEEAWIVKSSTPRPSDEECRKYLQKGKFDVLIVEYVWNSEDDDRRFVLSLFEDKHVKMRDPEEFLKASFDLFYKKLDFVSLMKALDTEVIGKEYLLLNRPDAAAIGIFNYWFSTHPIDLWKAGDEYSEQAIRDKVTARPDIEKTRLNFQGLLFRFNVDGRYDGPYYGFKTPCCKKEGNFWAVDFPRLFRWMEFMLFDSQGRASAP